MRQANAVFVFNRGYIGQFKVTFFSLTENNPKLSWTAHILYHGLTGEDKEDIARFIAGRGAQARFYEIDDSIFDGLPKMTYDTAHTAYYKVLVPYLLQEKGVYLFFDCDMIVKGDVSALLDLPETAFLSAVRDGMIEKNHKDHVERVTGSRGGVYFNSGFMRLDLSATGQIAPQEDVMAYLAGNARLIRWHDQDVLNHFYAAGCRVLPEKYNYLTTYRSLSDLFLRRGSRKAVVVHYANWKPWKNNYIGKCYGLYRKYYRKCLGEKGVDFLQRRSLPAQIGLIVKYVMRPFRKGDL